MVFNGASDTLSQQLSATFVGGKTYRLTVALAKSSATKNGATTTLQIRNGNTVLHVDGGTSGTFSTSDMDAGQQWLDFSVSHTVPLDADYAGEKITVALVYTATPAGHGLFADNVRLEESL